MNTAKGVKLGREATLSPVSVNKLPYFNSIAPR